MIENDGWSPAVPLSLSSSSHQDSSSFDRIRNRKSDLDKSQSKENLTSVINTIEKNVPIPEYLSGPSSHVSEELLSTSPPSLAQDVPLLRAILILCLSIACIGILASFIILLCTELAKSIGVDQSTIGATLVSLGAEVYQITYHIIYNIIYIYIYISYISYHIHIIYISYIIYHIL